MKPVDLVGKKLRALSLLLIEQAQILIVESGWLKQSRFHFYCKAPFDELVRPKIFIQLALRRGRAAIKRPTHDFIILK